MICVTDHLAEPEHTDAEGRRSSDGSGRRDDNRSPLVREVRALLTRAAEAIAASDARAAPARVAYLTLGDGESRDAATRVDALREQLRDTVIAIAQLDRAKGVPPERMVALIRSVLDDADEAALRRPAGRALKNDVVRWSIEAYYAG
jgi:hypothetical protein